MKINFNEMEAKVNNRFKDGEGDFIAKIKSDDLNKIIYGTLTPGSSLGYHKHETNSEIIYILEGNGKCKYEDEVQSLSKGDCHYCKKGHSHSLINDSDSDLKFFAVIPEQ